MSLHPTPPRVSEAQAQPESVPTAADHLGAIPLEDSGFQGETPVTTDEKSEA